MENYSKEYFLDRFQREETGDLLSKYANSSLSNPARQALLAILRERSVPEHEIWEANKQCEQCGQLFPVDSQLCPQCSVLEPAPVVQPVQARKPGGSIMKIGVWLLLLGPLSLLVMFAALFVQRMLPFRLFSDNFFLGGHWLAIAATMYLVPIGIVVIIIGSLVRLSSKEKS